MASEAADGSLKDEAGSAVPSGGTTDGLPSSETTHETGETVAARLTDDPLPETTAAADSESPPASESAESTYPSTAEGGVYPAYPQEPAGSGTTSDPAGNAAPATMAASTPPPTNESPEPGEDEEEGGGPIKPFLDHLEDLRWTLLKVVSSVALAMLVALVASDKLVAFLMWPLKHAQQLLPASQKSVPLLLGTNELGRVNLNALKLPTVYTNRIRSLELTPVPYGTNLLVTLQVQTIAPAAEYDLSLVVLKNYSPIGAFMVAIKLALYGGLVLASPFVIFFVGQFVLPALKVKEKAFLYRVAGIGSVLFFLGVAFCYFIIVQVALMASVQFSQWMGFGADEWRAEDYISFVCKFMLGMGLSFQLPLVILTLVKIGILDHRTLSKYRAYFVIGNLIVSAVVTPSGDPVTMLLMALPLQFLYEVSMIIAWYWARKDREREAAAD